MLPHWTRPVPSSHDGPWDRKDSSHLLSILWAIYSLGKWSFSWDCGPICHVGLQAVSITCSLSLAPCFWASLVAQLVKNPLTSGFIQKQLYFYQSLLKNKHRVPVLLKPISSQGFFPSLLSLVHKTSWLCLSTSLFCAGEANLSSGSPTLPSVLLTWASWWSIIQQTSNWLLPDHNSVWP